MEVKIKNGEEMIDATIEMVDDVMVVSPKVEKFEPKDGDVCNHQGFIYIFKGLRPSSVEIDKFAIIHHCYYDGETLEVKEGVGCGYINSSQRYATEKEKKKLFDKLEEEGYEWDAEKKELVKLKWKPVLGKVYYRPQFYQGYFEICKDVWNDSINDDIFYNKCWCFKTKEECQEFCNRLNDAINQVKP